MPTAVLARPDDFDGWRAAARGLAAARVPGEAIVWQVGDTATDLLGGDAAPAATEPMFTVPEGVPRHRPAGDLPSPIPNASPCSTPR